MFETSIDNKMNNLKVDFVDCCDIFDSKTVDCYDNGKVLLTASPVREYCSNVIDALDKSDFSTDIVTHPPGTQNIFCPFVYSVYF